VLQAARELNVKKIIHTSTSEVYGTARSVPITEDHPLQGQSPYAATKIGADQIALAFYRSFDTPVSVLRPFNTYGPRQSARAIIPTVISQIASGERKIKLGSLHPTRDFNYVKDTVRGFIACAESDHSIGEVINIGSGYEISIRDTIQLIAEVMGVDIELETEQVRVRPAKSEVERLCADNSKARMLLGWEPGYGGREGLKKGLSETVSWFLNPGNLSHYKAGIYNI
jgi:dTDP-glucose 4,6-dehydratase